MQIVIILLVHFIPQSLFFLHRINPRIPSTMRANTDITEPAMMESSEVSDIGVLARGPVGVVMLELEDIFISNQRCCFKKTKYIVQEG